MRSCYGNKLLHHRLSFFLFVLFFSSAKLYQFLAKLKVPRQNHPIAFKRIISNIAIKMSVLFQNQCPFRVNPSCINVTLYFNVLKWRLFGAERFKANVMFILLSNYEQACETGKKLQLTFPIWKRSLHEKSNFPLRISLVNVTKSRIWSHLQKKSLMENFIFCAVH